MNVEVDDFTIPICLVLCMFAVTGFSDNAD
jgi:hypothetical protein